MNTPPDIVPEYKDRRTGLILFGVLAIGLGALCALFVPLMLFGGAMSKDPAASRSLLPAALMYGGLAVMLIWLGVGSILLRRWARALLLILSWSWLIMGVIGCIFLALVSPQIFASVSQQSPSGAAVALVVAAVFLGVLFIGIPLAGVLFYGSKHVKATCEARDPVPRWTDHCPLPVLAAALWLGFSGVALLVSGLTVVKVLPLFGIFLSGLVSLGTTILLAAALGVGAWGFYKRDARAWWLVMVIMILSVISNAVTYSLHDLAEVYRLQGFSEVQIAQATRFNFLQGKFMLWNSLLWSLPSFAYLIYIRRFFKTSPAA